MPSILTPQMMRNVESEHMDETMTEDELILRAASRIADYVDNWLPRTDDRARSILAVAGPGNNGVDALVAGALLAQRGWSVRARLVGREQVPPFALLEGQLSSLELVEQLQDADIILDGIFGNSGRTDLPDDAAKAVKQINHLSTTFGSTVFAVDCPTGTNTLTGEVAATVVKADVTLCISNPKIGMLKPPAAEYLGDLIVLDIGLPDPDNDPDVNARMIDAVGVRESLPVRSTFARKLDVGGVLIVGGAPGYFGAPRLAGEAALRMGAGYVGLAVPRSIVAAIASEVPEIIFHPASDGDGRRSAEAVQKAIGESKRYSAIVLGPGLGRDEVARSLLRTLLDRGEATSTQAASSPVFGIPRRVTHTESQNNSRLFDLNWVIDADALNWLAEQENWHSLLEGMTCVLTPHIGEMARLLGTEVDDIRDKPWETAREAAGNWNQIVVLKGGFTCVATPEGDLYVSPRATPELATPGTGDVLSGMIGSLLSQGCNPVDAATSAVYIGAQAGKNAARRYGARSVIARDLINELAGSVVALESRHGRRQII